MSEGGIHETTTYTITDTHASSSLSSVQANFPLNPVMDHGHLSTLYPEGGSAIPGVPVDAPLTVKQHFQQQRKQQKRRARESRREEKIQAVSKLVTTSTTSLQTCITSTPIETIARSDAQQQVPYSSMVLPESTLLHQQQQQQQVRQSVSGSDDLPNDISVKMDSKLLGSFKVEDYDRVYGATTSAAVSVSGSSGHFPLRSIEEPSFESSLRNNAAADSYDSLFQLAEVDSSGRRPFDIIARSEGVRTDFPVNSFEHTINQTPIVPLSESSRLENCIPAELSNIYASVDGLDMQNVPNDNGIVGMNGPLDQNHVDADPNSFDQGVEKLETETDDRFLNWLYCENEHAEDDNAEYTRVLEEIERDECYAFKMESENQQQDFGMTCPSSSAQADGLRKSELDPSHPLSTDCVVGEYASLPPTMPPREPVPEGYVMNDYESDLDLDMMPIGEDEETMYGRLLDVLVRDIKLLTYNNAALVDEVSRLNYAILIASEERKVLARRSCHHDRNRIRRLQTANKRKSDAQRRQQEQLTLAETQENIAQIKAKMAKTIMSPQKAKPPPQSSITRPPLDVAAIKRSVEAEQRAFEDKLPPKKSKRKSASSKSQRKRPDSQRSEKGSSLQNGNGGATKRMRIDSERMETSEELLEGSTTPTADQAIISRKSVRSSGSGGEPSDEQIQRRRSGRQISTSQECTATANNSLSSIDDVQDASSVSSTNDQGTAAEVVTSAEEGALQCGESGKDDDPQSWRRRSGRPPARAASAAAQTLLAAELAATEEVPTYSPRKPNRSRINTNESPIARSQKSKRSIASVNSPLEQNVEESTSHPIAKELAVEIDDDAMNGNGSTSLCDLEFDQKDDVVDEELPLDDMLEGEESGARSSLRLRPSKRSTRTSSRQSFGDGTETPRRISRSPSHEDPATGEEPVSRATRSHGRGSGSAMAQGERQTRERKQPVLYSPVAKSFTGSQPRTVKRKS